MCIYTFFLHGHTDALRDAAACTEFMLPGQPGIGAKAESNHDQYWLASFFSIPGLGSRELPEFPLFWETNLVPSPCPDGRNGTVKQDWALEGIHLHIGSGIYDTRFLRRGPGTGSHQ